MEDQLNLLDKYFKLYDDKNYKERIYEFSYDSMIDHFFEYDIYKYDEGELSDKDTVNEEFEKLILETKDLELKPKLIPLILFLDKKYWEHLLEMSYFDDMNLILLDDLKSFSIKFEFNKINKSSNVYENIQDMIKGFKKKEFKKIIDFNMNPDMGNNQYSRFIYLIAKEKFFCEYCQALDEKDDLTFLFLLINLEYGQKDGFDKRLEILDYLSRNKCLLKIKLLKDILLNGDNEDFICKAIIYFSKKMEMWKQFTSFYLDSPSQYPKLFKPLSKTIIELDENKIDLLLNSIKLSKFLSSESKEALNSCFLNIKKGEIKKYCLEILFLRWLEFIDTSCDYFGSIVLTDIIDLVVVYIREFKNKNAIVQEIERVLYNLEEIDNKWFIDKLEYSNYFYKQMTKLYVYGFSLEKYKLYDLKEKISIICSGNPILKNEKKTIELFEKHIT